MVFPVWAWPWGYTDQKDEFLTLKELTVQVGKRMVNLVMLMGVKQMWAGSLSCYPSLE